MGRLLVAVLDEHGSDTVHEYEFVHRAVALVVIEDGLRNGRSPIDRGYSAVKR